MNMQARVSTLKQQLEQLFPGKWLSGAACRGNLKTGIEVIDQGLTRGIARRQITEWNGPLSSGKSTILRAAITGWCNAGLNVAYIDSQGKLLAADWSLVDRGHGKFWIVRPPDDASCASRDQPVVPLISRKTLLAQEAIWSADQFIRSNAFDVVVLDLGNMDPGGNKRQGIAYSPVPGRVYARLKRALSKTRAALIVVRDIPAQPDSSAAAAWGCYARFNFDIGTSIYCQEGPGGVAVIQPAVKFSVFKDGLSQTREVMLGSSVPNRLFTHPRVPDRRTSKTGSRTQG